MAGIHFDITASDTNFKATLDQVRARVEATSKTIQTLGKHDSDISTIAKKMESLNRAIEGNENSIVSLNAQLKQWETQAAAAAAAGDMGTFRTITKDIEDQVQQIQALITQTNEYREALATIDVDGLFQSQGGSVMLFKSQADYDYAEQLRQKIQELQAQIGNFQGSEGDLMGLTSALSDTREELAACEQKAAGAAAALGTDLGGRAAEASAQLYELNNAIDEQQGVIVSLEAAVNSAAKEIEALKAASASTDEILAARANYDALSASLSNAKLSMSNLQAAQEDAKTKLASVNAEITQHESVLVKMLGGYDKFQGVISHLPQPIQSVITSITGMTGAAKAFIATPLGAVIGAIVLVLQALKTWFDSSAEGQMAFAQVSGYVSGVLGQLKEIVIAVGNAIYKAFSDPKEAVSDLWEAIKTNIVNRFKAVGQLAAHVGEVITSAFSSPEKLPSLFKEIGNDLLQLTTGVDGLIDKNVELVKKFDDVGKKTAALRVREEQLHRDRSKWQIEEQKMENQLKELQNKAMTGTKSERIAAQKEAAQLVDKMIGQRKAFAQEELNIIKERNALTTNAQANYDAEYAAEAKLLALEGERTQMMMRFNRQAASAGRSLESLAEQQERALQRQQQAAVSLSEKEAQLALENRQADIDLMDEGHDKRMAQIEQEYKLQLNEVEKLANDMRQLNVKAGINVGVDGLTDKQRNELTNRRDLIESGYTKKYNDVFQEERNAMNEYLKEYGTYLEKRNALIELANDKMAKATTEGEKKNIAAQLTRDLSELDIKAQEKTSAIGKLFGDMSDKAIADMRAIAETAQQALNFLSSGKWDETKGLQFGITKETFETWSKSPEQLAKIKKSIRELIDQADAAENPFKRLADNIKDLFKKPAEGEAGKSTETKLKKLAVSASECADMVGNVAGKMAEMFEAAGNTEAADAMETTQQLMSTVSNIGKGFAEGGLVGGIAAAAGEAIGYITSAFQASARHAAALKEIMAETTAQQRAYTLAILETNLAFKEAETIFGSIDYMKAANAVGVMRDAYNELNASIRGTSEQQAKFDKNAKGWGSLINRFNYSAIKDQYSGLADIQIKTGHKKTGLFGWGKGKDIYSSILDAYPELIDKSGKCYFDIY